MILAVAWVLVALWVGIVVGHSIATLRRRLEEMPPIPLGDALTGRAYQCLWIVSTALDYKRPATWGARRAWPVVRHMRRGHVYYANEVQFAFDRFEERVELDSREILAGDPAGKLEAAARRLAARIGEKHVAAFGAPEHAHADFCGVYTDHCSGVTVRLTRAYDVYDDRFVTFLDALVAVA